MRFPLLFIVSVFLSVAGYSQAWEESMDYAGVADSIIVALQRIDTGDNANEHYEVNIKNLKVDPICIVHSAHYFLYEGFPPLQLALYKQKDGFEIFNLGWVKEDTERDDHYSMDYLNAEPILPNQTLRFALIIPEYLAARQIVLNYLVMPDLRYKQFKQEIYKNGEWFKGRKMREIVVLPGHLQDSKPAYSKKVFLELEDSLGAVSMNVPGRFDTSFAWINRSDCGRACEEMEYRFQSKALKIHKESGFYYKDWPKDSVEQMTIHHTRDTSYRKLAKKDTFITVSELNHLEAQLDNEWGYRSVVFAVRERIGGRFFNIVGVEKKNSVRDVRVVAQTTVEGTTISFEYHLMTGESSSISANFFGNALELIRTIRIGPHND